MKVKTTREINKTVTKAADKIQHRRWILSYGFTAGIFLLTYFLLVFDGFGLADNYRSLFQRLCIAGGIVCSVFIATKALVLFITQKSATRKVKYIFVRLIRFPNTLILQSEVYNYSWKKFPFSWNEIPFHVAYESNFGYVEDTIRAVATKSWESKWKYD